MSKKNNVQILAGQYLLTSKNSESDLKGNACVFKEQNVIYQLFKNGRITENKESTVTELLKKYRFVRTS